MLRSGLSLVLLCFMLVSCANQAPETQVNSMTSEVMAVTNPIASNGISYRYLFARIEPISHKFRMDRETESLWLRGAYFYLNPDGLLGLNWSKPGSYAYDSEYSWHMEGDKLVIVLGLKTTYSFDVSKYSFPMVTHTDQGGKFKMTTYKKTKEEK